MNQLSRPLEERLTLGDAEGPTAGKLKKLTIHFLVPDLNFSLN